MTLRMIWVNGAFGSGKTTLVGELSRRVPEALVYDPEQTGYLLREIVPVPWDNFQRLPLWRKQVVSTALGLLEEYGRPLLAAQTLVDAAYGREIFGGLRAAGVDVRHVCLRVSPAELERRIDGRTTAPGDPGREAFVRRWCKEQNLLWAGAADGLRDDGVVLDGHRPVADLADEVLAGI
ncbi:AAA family ATPase [Streptomyces avicenniae]|uniref:AAA family ATPase n=1 Tax=Streptomyces avicenniae TaxID=500153 RepID=UPI001CBA69BF|nr:AAA family ATPase [Streptomyces avicenniae]